MPISNGWTVDECPDAFGYWTIRPADGTVNGDIHEEPIATVYEHENSGPIAAAPEMVDALERIYDAGCIDADDGALALEALSIIRPLASRALLTTRTGEPT